MSNTVRLSELGIARLAYLSGTCCMKAISAIVRWPFLCRRRRLDSFRAIRPNKRCCTLLDAH